MGQRAPIHDPLTHCLLALNTNQLLAGWQDLFTAAGAHFLG